MEKVIVLLASYNGEKYLRDQLDSLINQTYKNIDVYIRAVSYTHLKILPMK